MIYQGASSSGNLLETTNTCYNGSSTPCTGTAIAFPFSQRTITTQIGSNGLQAQRVENYNSYSLLTATDDYDFGSGSPGPLLRKTLTTYASLGNGIVDRVS